MSDWIGVVNFFGWLSLGILGLISCVGLVLRLRAWRGEATGLLASLQQEVRSLHAKLDRQEFLLNTLHLGVNSPIVLGYDWTISYDQANLVLDELCRRSSFTMLELGSGASTVVWAASIMAKHDCQLYSLEAEDEYYFKTKHLLESHGVLDSRVHLILAPFRNYSVNSQIWQWYDLDALPDADKFIDVLLVDGPPDTLQFMSRYPALPLLWDRLTSDCVIIVDDGYRTDETQIVNRWVTEFPDLYAQQIATKKGTWVLRKRKGA